MPYTVYRPINVEGSIADTEEFARTLLEHSICKEAPCMPMYTQVQPHAEACSLLTTLMQLLQLASLEWYTKAQAKLQLAGIPWKGHWDLHRAEFCSSIFMMHDGLSEASLMRQSSSGLVF